MDVRQFTHGVTGPSKLLTPAKLIKADTYSQGLSVSSLFKLLFSLFGKGGGGVKQRLALSIHHALFLEL